MHGLPRMAPQSIWLNGAPTWPPCEMWSSSKPPGVVVGNNVVLTGMQLLSTTSKFNSPTPETRQVTGGAHLTQFVQVLVAVLMILPLMSKTHSLDLPATVPCTV